MHRLQLDYISRPGSARWLGIGLLAIAALAGAKQADIFVTAKREISQLEARLSRLESRDRPAAKAALPESTIREIRRANDVIEQIALPWDRLFRAVESAAGEKVGLLGITPDQKSGTVEVGGEAADLNAMFDYVKRLQRQPSLTRVYLLNHKLNDQDPQHPIRFTVTASWLEKTPGS
ncbi:MAG TPA: PilN domain-containing protein [Burkholderiales bacterium]